MSKNDPNYDKTELVDEIFKAFERFLEEEYKTNNTIIKPKIVQNLCK